MSIYHPPLAEGPANKEELDRLVSMLDDKEIEIAVAYLSNLVLARSKPIDGKLYISHN